MNDAADKSNLWTNCPSGLLVGRAQSARRMALGMLAVKTTAIFLVVAGTTFGSWWGFVQYSVREYQFSGLTCADVRELMPKLKAGRLSTRLEEMLRKHVARCPTCHPLGEQLPAKNFVAIGTLKQPPGRFGESGQCGCCQDSSEGQSPFLAIKSPDYSTVVGN